MSTKITTLDELFRQDEEERVAKAREEQMAEEKAWWALPHSERVRITAERDAKWDAIWDTIQAEKEDADQDEDEEQEDEE